MFGGVKLAKNAEPNKYSYSGYGIGFDFRSFFHFQILTVVILGVDNSSSVHIDNKKKDILVSGKGPTQGLDDTTITVEAEYSINFSRSNRNSSFV